jgi:hypothetical protein
LKYCFPIVPTSAAIDTVSANGNLKATEPRALACHR